MDEYVLQTGIIASLKKSVDEDNCYRQFYIIISRFWNGSEIFIVPDKIVSHIISYMIKMDYINSILTFLKSRSNDSVINVNHMKIFVAATKTQKINVAKMLLDEIKNVFVTKQSLSSVSEYIARANPDIIPFLAEYFSADDYRDCLVKYSHVPEFYNENIVNLLTYNDRRYQLNYRDAVRIFRHKTSPAKIVDAVYDYKKHKSHFRRIFENWPEVAERYAKMYVDDRKREIKMITAIIDKVETRYNLKI